MYFDAEPKRDIRDFFDMEEQLRNFESALNSAVQPYLQELTACQTEWTNTLNTYLQEDNVAGTSLTQAQQANLNYIMNTCVNPAAKGASTAVQPFNWQANMDHHR